MFCISISHRDPGEGRGRGEGSRHEVPEPRRRPELKGQTQFRSLFHWGFRLVPGIQGGPPPNAVPPFPVLMAGNLRSARVAVDVYRLWGSANGNGERGPTALLIRRVISRRRHGLDGGFLSQAHHVKRHVETFCSRFTLTTGMASANSPKWRVASPSQLKTILSAMISGHRCRRHRVLKTWLSAIP